jgi:hypothetical protein
MTFFIKLLLYAYCHKLILLMDGLLWGTSGGEGLPERVVSLILQERNIGKTPSQWPKIDHENELR